MKIFIILGILVISTGCFILFRKKGSSAKIPTVTLVTKRDANDFVKKIEELGYFKYAAKKDIAILKADMVNYYDPNNEITTIWDDATGLPKDYRYYTCDGESVFELGGVSTLLKELKPTFNKIGFKCIVTNDIESWDEKNNWLNHSIMINGNSYTLFKNFKDTGWGEAPMRLAEILNKELEKQGIAEKIYLANGGNDGRLIFLTDDLYKYIYSIYKNPNWKPLELHEWATVMNVK